MKIYVASHDLQLGQQVAEALKQQGYEITARWLRQEFKHTDERSEEDKRRIACEDYNDVVLSDILVLISGNDKYPGGKFVEVGIALARGKEVIVIGRRENMLMWHPLVSTCANVYEVIEYLTKVKI